MSASWKTVRVFVSSTFRDMHAERDHLVKVVFPALRERLEVHRIHLIDVDLRWGLTREQAENDRIVDLCLAHIDECRPFFVGILGERYGSVPLRYPADALRRYGWMGQHLNKSVTELEILHGILGSSGMHTRAFFYFRDPRCLQSIPDSLRYAVYAETDAAAIDKLAELKARIRRSGNPVLENYPARWDPRAFDRPTRTRGRLVDLEEFGTHVETQIWDEIAKEHGLEKSPAGDATDPLGEENDFHERFIESRTRVFVGREVAREQLYAFATGTEQIPCLVTGASGSGKSALLAQCVMACRQRYAGVFVLPHFVGASPRSTSLVGLLTHLCLGLQRHFGFTHELPAEPARLAALFQKMLDDIPPEGPVVLVIDAINQLDEADHSRSVEWLPRALPAHVKCILSCTSDGGEAVAVREAFAHRPHYRFHLEPLDDAERRAIIREIPSISAKTLEEEQVALLLDNPATANPLFLLVALEELRGFGSYERLNERIRGLPRGADALTELFVQVIERVEEDFDSEAARAVLGMLASARRGLAEREVQQLLEGTDGAVDLFPILRQMRPYLLKRGSLLGFYHDRVLSAVRQKYLTTLELRVAAHARLAAYFNAQEYFLESEQTQRERVRRLPPTPRPANVRKVDELPWHLLRLAALSAREDPSSPAWDAVAELFTDPTFLEAKVEARA